MYTFDRSRLIPDEQKYDFFISYSHKDKGIALDIKHIAIANGLNAWLDDRDIGYGDHIKETAALGIQNSKAFLIINSVHSASSVAVDKEIDQALQLMSIKKAEGVSYPIITFRIDSKPVMSKLQAFKYVENCEDHPLPAILKLIQFLTGRDMFDTYLRGAHTSAIGSNSFEQQKQFLGIFDAYSYAVLIQTTSFLKKYGARTFPRRNIACHSAINGHEQSHECHPKKEFLVSTWEWSFRINSPSAHA